MAVTHMATGRIKAILYYQNQQGRIMMLPTDEETKRFRKQMEGLGYMLMGAETLKEAEILQKKLQEQLKVEQQQELAYDDSVTSRGRAAVGERLRRKLASSSTSEYEKDFIRAYLVWRENKHALFQKKFTSEIGHLDQLEFDNCNNRVADLMNRV